MPHPLYLHVLIQFQIVSAFPICQEKRKCRPSLTCKFDPRDHLSRFFDVLLSPTVISIFHGNWIRPPAILTVREVVLTDPGGWHIGRFIDEKRACPLFRSPADDRMHHDSPLPHDKMSIVHHAVFPSPALSICQRKQLGTSSYARKLSDFDRNRPKHTHVWRKEAQGKRLPFLFTACRMMAKKVLLLKTGESFPGNHTQIPLSPQNERDAFRLIPLHHPTCG